jgi:hypothetical protein
MKEKREREETNKTATRDTKMPQSTQSDDGADDYQEDSGNEGYEYAEDEEYEYDESPPENTNKRLKRETSASSSQEVVILENYERSQIFTLNALSQPLLKDLIRTDESAELKASFTTTGKTFTYTVKASKLLKLLTEDAINQLVKERNTIVHDLPEFFSAVTEYMAVLRQQCPLCYHPHERIVDRMTPCGDPKCMTAFMENGLGRNILADIVYEPEMVELLICMAYWATDETRLDVLDMNFNHFPVRFIQNVKGTNQSEASPTTAIKQYGNIKEALDRLPSMPIMKDMIDNGLLDSYMNDTPYNYESYYLLQWIINSNRTQLKYIAKDKQTEEELKITQDGKFHLFAIKNSPEKENNFEVEKAIHNQEATEFTYHGSRATSWHSIVRNSLKSLSNTIRQVNGAVYGSGIYMTTDFNVALGYTHPTRSNWSQKTLNVTRCILMLELIRSDSLRKNTPVSFRVETNEDHVIARYLICQ